MKYVLSLALAAAISAFAQSPADVSFEASAQEATSSVGLCPITCPKNCDALGHCPRIIPRVVGETEARPARPNPPAPRPCICQDGAMCGSGDCSTCCKNHGGQWCKPEA